MGSSISFQTISTLLRGIDNNVGITMADLYRKLDNNRSIGCINITLKIFLDKGLIEKRPDGRKKRLFLTPRGRTLILLIYEIRRLKLGFLT